jgi:hypothetical protein
MVAPQPRSIASSANFFCSALPLACRICAKAGPEEYM